MSNDLTIEEKACNYATMRHIERLRNLLNIIVIDLLTRGEQHDQTKLEPPEVAAFTALTPELSNLHYGSEEYARSKELLGDALVHHYAKNRHHPEHYANGVDDMNLIDLIEMLCDWKAASERHNSGNIRTSIDLNAQKYKINPQLARIMRNTVDYLRM